VEDYSREVADQPAAVLAAEVHPALRLALPHLRRTRTSDKTFLQLLLHNSNKMPCPLLVIHCNGSRFEWQVVYDALRYLTVLHELAGPRTRPEEQENISMLVLSKKMGAWMAVAALGTAGLIAQTPPTTRHSQRQGRSGALIAAALNLTDAQKSQMKSIFQEARQSSQPVRQQLKQTRQSMQAAVQAGDSNQIQQLSATEGTEMGQLAAIRASAHAKMFKMLTPEQQQKLATIQASMHNRRHGPGAPVQN
jgi:Spy/CpxP family protein refolding chaperone